MTTKDEGAPRAEEVRGRVSAVEQVQGLTGKDISTELWREYAFPDGTVYRIIEPVALYTLYTRPGGTTHRVVDSKGVVHCVTFPGPSTSTVLRWKNSGGPPVSF